MPKYLLSGCRFEVLPSEMDKICQVGCTGCPKLDQLVAESFGDAGSPAMSDFRELGKLDWSQQGENGI